MDSHEVIIIGSGPSGLAIAALLNKNKIENIILEKESIFGGTYAIINPDIFLLSPGKFNALPLVKGEWKNDSITVGEYYNYLVNYKESQKINIQYNTKIIQILPFEQGYKLISESGKEYLCKKLIMATGMISFPNKQKFNYQENPDVEFQLAKEFKGNEYYRGKNVLILGSGTSAIEIATLLAGISNVYLAIKEQLITFPLFIMGINTHYFIQYLEKIPIKYLKKRCDGKWTHPGLDFGINEAINNEQVILCNNEFILKNNIARFNDQKEFNVDIFINATGYNFDTGILPADIKRKKNGLADTTENESTSHKNLFILGHPCAGGLDSPFLRGIRKDVYRILNKLQK